MGLKNFQYNKILRDYDRKQLENKSKLDHRIENAYQRIPKFKEVDNLLIDAAMTKARQLLASSDNNTLLNDLKKTAEAVKNERKSLLLDHGFPEDYLDLQYECGDCKDTGYIDNEKCHCFKQSIVSILYSQSNIQTAIAKENFSKFSFDFYPDNCPDESTGLTPRQNIEKVVRQSKDFINSFDDKFENLLIYGNTGVGKTFLSNCIAKELLDKSYTVIYLTAFQLFDILEKNKFNKDDDSQEVQSKFNYILSCDLLIIDDLGTELTNAFINTQLYLCVNERYLREKSTIISTNLSLDNIVEKYSERIFSRIISNYTLLKIVGSDIRLTKNI